MKLIFAITERALAREMLAELSGRGFPVTLLHEEGGVLVPGQGTLMLGVPNGAADYVIRYLIERCGTRADPIDALLPASDPTEYLIREQSVIVQGGLAMYVLNVARFERIA